MEVKDEKTLEIQFVTPQNAHLAPRRDEKEIKKALEKEKGEKTNGKDNSERN